MPVLPDANSLGQRPVPQPQRRVSSVRNAGAVAEAVGAGGAKISKYGERLDEIKDEDDARRRDLEHLEAVRAIRQTAKAAQGVDAQGAAARAEEEIQRLNARVLKDARSPRSRAVLETSIARRSITERDSISEHALRETSSAMEGTLLAGRDADMNEATEAWDRPELVEEHLTSARSKIASWGKWKGLSADQITLEQKAAGSKVRQAVAERMITAGDYDGALAYTEAHRGEIDHQAENSIRVAIRGPMVDMAGETIVDNLQALGGAGGPPPPTPTETAVQPHTLATRMVGITLIAEGGGTLANPKTSPVGARGPMQVMPGTDTDPGYGVTPMRANTEAERARVGRDYLAALTKHYGGDPAKAWAAYNWGPGNLDNAIRRYGANWLAHAPKETRDYVNGNLAMLRRGGGQSVPGDVPTGQRVDYTAARREINEQDLPYDLKRSALNALDRRVAAEDRVIQRTEGDATRQALEVVERLGEGFTSMDQIPANVRSRMSVQHRIDLAAQAQQNAAPKEIRGDGEIALSLTLQSISNPESFKAEDLRLYRHQVTRQEFATLSAAQAKMRAEPPGASPTANIRNEIAETINFYAPDIGLPRWSPTDGFDGKPGIEAGERTKYLRIFDTMRQHLDNITEGKRAPTNDEMKGAFDRATLTLISAGTGQRRRLYDVPVGERGTRVQVEIKLGTMSRIRDAYKDTHGGIEPTPQQIQRIYMDNLGRPGFW